MKTERTRRLPEFFTQVIGSLPRPRLVLDLLQDRERTEPARHRKVMDEMVRFAIRLQEQAGIDVVSDGEWRRRHYTDEFLIRIGGFAPVREFRHQGETRHALVVTEKMSHPQPVFREDAAFLVSSTDRLTKFALPSPFLVGIRYWDERYSRAAYPTREGFMEHLAAILKKEAHRLVDEGIDIVQLDDPALTCFCDRRLTSGEKIHDERLHKEWDPDREVPFAVGLLNTVAEGLAAEVHLHCCHSVYKRASDVKGNYAPLLPRLGDLEVDRLNLEFAYDDTGEVDDLTLLPAHLSVGMGVVDVRKETTAGPQEVARLAEKGARILGMARVALNPDCGFAPDAYEPPSIDEAFTKLKILAEGARLVRERLHGGAL
jgi:5-methyltetrahydropteroyltriglutamate--homocysteine methyltransferase